VSRKDDLPDGEREILPDGLFCRRRGARQDGQAKFRLEWVERFKTQHPRKLQSIDIASLTHPTPGFQEDHLTISSALDLIFELSGADYFALCGSKRI
jgi:hypothetical protein